MRFYNRIIVLYRTIIYLFLFHSPKSHPVKFQQKNSMGEHRQSRDWANKQQWTARIRSNQVRLQIKIPSIASKFILQKTEVTHHSIPSINTPINPSSTPSSPPPWGAHLGRANAPGGSPGSRTLRGSSTTRWNNFTWLTWSEKGGNIILSKSANPSRSRRENLSRNDKSNDTTNENRLCRRLADTRDLKSFSGDRVRAHPRRQY